MIALADIEIENQKKSVKISEISFEEYVERQRELQDNLEELPVVEKLELELDPALDSTSRPAADAGSAALGPPAEPQVDLAPTAALPLPASSVFDRDLRLLSLQCQLDGLNLVSWSLPGGAGALSLQLGCVLLTSDITSQIRQMVNIRVPSIRATGLQLDAPPTADNTWCAPFGVRATITRQRADPHALVWSKSLALELDPINLAIDDRQMSFLRQLFEEMQLTQLKQILIEFGWMDPEHLRTTFWKNDSSVHFDQHKEDFRMKTLGTFDHLTEMVTDVDTLVAAMLGDNDDDAPVPAPPPREHLPAAITPLPSPTLVLKKQGPLGFSRTEPQAEPVSPATVELYEGGWLRVLSLGPDAAPLFEVRLTPHSSIQTKVDIDLCLEITENNETIYLVATNDEDFIEWMNLCIRTQVSLTLGDSGSAPPASSVAPLAEVAEPPPAVPTAKRHHDSLQQIAQLLGQIRQELQTTRADVSSLTSETLFWLDDLKLREQVLALENRLQAEELMRQDLVAKLAALQPPPVTPEPVARTARPSADDSVQSDYTELLNSKLSKLASGDIKPPSRIGHAQPAPGGKPLAAASKPAASLSKPLHSTKPQSVPVATPPKPTVTSTAAPRTTPTPHAVPGAATRPHPTTGLSSRPPSTATPTTKTATGPMIASTTASGSISKPPTIGATATSTTGNRPPSSTSGARGAPLPAPGGKPGRGQPPPPPARQKPDSSSGWFW
jgi:hypothetical protein